MIFKVKNKIYHLRKKFQIIYLFDLRKTWFQYFEIIYYNYMFGLCYYFNIKYDVLFFINIIHLNVYILNDFFEIRIAL